MDWTSLVDLWHRLPRVNVPMIRYASQTFDDADLLVYGIDPMSAYVKGMIVNGAWDTFVKYETGIGDDYHPNSLAFVYVPRQVNDVIPIYSCVGALHVVSPIDWKMNGSGILNCCGDGTYDASFFGLQN